MKLTSVSKFISCAALMNCYRRSHLNYSRLIVNSLTNAGHFDDRILYNYILFQQELTWFHLNLFVVVIVLKSILHCTCVPGILVNGVTCILQLAIYTRKKMSKETYILYFKKQYKYRILPITSSYIYPLQLGEMFYAASGRRCRLTFLESKDTMQQI